MLKRLAAKGQLFVARYIVRPGLKQKNPAGTLQAFPAKGSEVLAEQILAIEDLQAHFSAVPNLDKDGEEMLFSLNFPDTQAVPVEGFKALKFLIDIKTEVKPLYFRNAFQGANPRGITDYTTYFPPSPSGQRAKSELSDVDTIVETVQFSSSPP